MIKSARRYYRHDLGALMNSSILVALFLIIGAALLCFASLVCQTIGIVLIIIGTFGFLNILFTKLYSNIIKKII